MKPIQSYPRPSSYQSIKNAQNERILILDGAMGTLLQNNDGCSCQHCDNDARNNLSDLLNISHPEKIINVHNQYLPYADIIETNTFNSNAISLSDYNLQDQAYDLNVAGARIARQAADTYMKNHNVLRFVAGSMGPSSKLLSMCRQFGDKLTMDEMAAAYKTQASGLIDGGVDFLLIETSLDLLNVKAAIAGAQSAMRERNINFPISFSFTIDKGDRILSGTTLESMAEAVMNTNPLSIGMNCGAGAEQLLPLLGKLSRFSTAISVYPNAGLPDEMGAYTQTPEIMAAHFHNLFKTPTRINIIGGCCGTTPAHIAALAEEAKNIKPLAIPEPSETFALAGASPLRMNPDSGIIVTGERCNVAGSRKFLRLISERNFTEALDVARAQINKGAQVLDINMDAPLLDAKEAMTEFIGLLADDPQLAELPIMVDSSDFNVIEAALKIIPGRPIVNSISLKEGEDTFIRRAVACHDAGAAVVVMAFDEKGQATDTERRVEICRRSVRLLREAGLTFRDIVFDPNILTVATGIAEHDLYGKYLLDAISEISSEFPDLIISGGLSNLSFAFRGNDFVRNAIHSVFLHHAIKRGMRMAIINPGATPDYNSLPEDLRAAIENLLFGAEGATDALVSLVNEKYPRPQASPKPAVKPTVSKDEVTDEELDNAICSHLYSGIEEGVIPLVERAVKIGGSAYGIVNNVLLKGMDKVGAAFSRNELFLPQIVRSAGVMKKIMEYLTPLIEKEKSGPDTSSSAGKVILATVKGDVHDIGKNIVGVVLRCNGFEVIDLGVMVPPENIIAAVREFNADAVAVSGLITPSLAEMETLASMMQAQNLTVPLFVGGATTSDRHTEIKLTPRYSNGTVFHTTDAASLAAVMSKVLNSSTDKPASSESNISGSETSIKSLRLPAIKGAVKKSFEFHISELRPLINFRAFLGAWKLSPALAEKIKDGLPQNHTAEEAEAFKIIADANNLLDKWASDNVTIKGYAVEGTAVADKTGDILTISSGSASVRLPLLRRRQHPARSLSDYYKTDKPIYIFAVSPGKRLAEKLCADSKSYEGILSELLLSRLAEAATEALHRVLTDGIDKEPIGIRPAVGYPSLPDQSVIFILNRLLDVENSPLDIFITENGAISPSASTLGLIIPDKDASYFSVHPLSEQQIEKYAGLRGLDRTAINKFLPLQD